MENKHLMPAFLNCRSAPCKSSLRKRAARGICGAAATCSHGSWLLASASSEAVVVSLYFLIPQGNHSLKTRNRGDFSQTTLESSHQTFPISLLPRFHLQFQLR